MTTEILQRVPVRFRSSHETRELKIVKGALPVNSSTGERFVSISRDLAERGYVSYRICNNDETVIFLFSVLKPLPRKTLASRH